MEARRLNILWSFGFLASGLLASQPSKVTIPRLYETQKMTDDKYHSILVQKFHQRFVKGIGLLDVGQVPGSRQNDQLRT